MQPRNHALRLRIHWGIGLRWLILMVATAAFLQVVQCAAQSTSTVTLVGQTAGFGPGYDEIGRMKSSALREKLLRAIDAGEFGVNDYIPIDTSPPNFKITVLCAATLQGNVKTIEELIKRGAEPNQSCAPNGSRFPLDVMIEKDRKYTFYFDETIATLRSHGAQLKKTENQVRLERHLSELRAEAAQSAENRRQLLGAMQGAAEIAGQIAVARAVSGSNSGMRIQQASPNPSLPLVGNSPAPSLQSQQSSSASQPASAAILAKNTAPIVVENNSKPVWTYNADAQFEGFHGESQDEACKAAERKIADFAPNVADVKRKLISRGACDCKERTRAGYFCYIPYKMQITTPHDPAKKSGISDNVSR